MFRRRQADLHKIWPHRWVNPKTKQGPSRIHGMGLMAVGDIAKNEVIIVYGGVIVPKTDIPNYRSIMGNYDYPIDANFSIAPTNHEELKLTGSINHSCEPNAGWNGVLTLAAIRDIAKGEEIATDYALMGGYSEPFSCNCQTPSCRKTVTPDDWKSEEIRRKYGDWFIPVLKSKF